MESNPSYEYNNLFPPRPDPISILTKLSKMGWYGPIEIGYRATQSLKEKTDRALPLEIRKPLRDPLTGEEVLRTKSEFARIKNEQFTSKNDLEWRARRGATDAIYKALMGWVEDGNLPGCIGNEEHAEER